ncbi:MAG: Fic family protein [Gemmatimonadaceae bacterium]
MGKDRGEGIAHEWRPLADYEADPASLASAELRQLAAIWEEQRQALEAAEGLKTFNERLRREWAIETGLLERLYTFDRGVTQLLIEEGVDAALIHQHGTNQDPVRVVAMIRDHESTIDGLFDFVARRRELTASYIKEVHTQLTRNQPTTTAVDTLGRAIEVDLRHGAYKLLPNNPIRPNGQVHQYCPPEQVASEMDRLVALHGEHAAAPPEVEAAWLHHRFTQIHPFQDGNGRVARCLATLLLIRTGWFPLVIRDVQEERKAYLDALEAGDAGNLKPLVDVFAAAQRKAFVQALGISGQVLSLTRAEHVIAAARRKLESRERAIRAEWKKAKATADLLRSTARDRFETVAKELRTETARYFRDAYFRADTEPDRHERSYYFRWQIIETAKQIGYFANTTDYTAWSRLLLRTGPQAEIVVSFHAVGHDYRGILAVSACFFRREETEDGEREIAGLTPLTLELFQINYLEGSNDAAIRFHTWLEEVLVKGLELWRQGL